VPSFVAPLLRNQRVKCRLPKILAQLDKKHIGDSGQYINSRASLLTELHDRPASPLLQAYFERLASGPATCDTQDFVDDTQQFIEGGKQFAEICGSARDTYYGNPLGGLFLLEDLVRLWNSTYPEQPCTIWDDDFRLQCPPSWSSEVQKGRWVLRYLGEDLFGSGFNELLRGPTAISCSMWIPLCLWMALRWVKGDEILRQKFKFSKGQFSLTQHWDKPMNDDGTQGNLLFSFYDLPHGKMADAPIQSKALFNDPNYLIKHPGGAARLENAILFNGEYVIFDPGSPNVWSHSDLEERLRQCFNAPQDEADFRELFRYTFFPDNPHHLFPEQTLGDFVKDAEKHADDTLDETQWNDRLGKRTQGSHLAFNVERLMSCLDGVTALDEGLLRGEAVLKLEVEGVFEVGDVLDGGNGGAAEGVLGDAVDVELWDDAADGAKGPRAGAQPPGAGWV
jgi:hypothetical protein